MFSIHAPREGSGYQPGSRGRGEGRNFSIHAPREGSGLLSNIARRDKTFSIHAPREGSGGDRVVLSPFSHFSIHAPREGSGGAGGADAGRVGGFSIHAPREGSGTLEERPSKSDNYFSIHAPREGSGSGASWAIACPSASFLSTLPGRGAAYSNRRTGRPRRIFYPRSPGGERQVFDLHSVDISLFSIHAPREGSGAAPGGAGRGAPAFSIHAPREGSGRCRC